MQNRKECGFSLIELLIAMAITGIASAAIYSVYQSSVRSSVIQNTAAGVQQSVRAGLEMMVQDIRMAGYDPKNTANTGVVILQADKIYITSDRNGNGQIEEVGDPNKCESFECITYEFVGTQLRQILNENFSNQSTSQPIIDNVVALEFSPSSLGSLLNWVDITLTVEENAGLHATVERTLETRVFLRNL